MSDPLCAVGNRKWGETGTGTESILLTLNLNCASTISFSGGITNHTMFRRSARKAVGTSLVVLIVICLIGVAGVAFYFGQNIFKSTNNSSSTNQSQTVQSTVSSISTTQANLNSQTMYTTTSTTLGKVSQSQTVSTTSSQTSKVQTTQSTTTSQVSLVTGTTVTLKSGDLFAGVMQGSPGTANASGSPYVSMVLNNPGQKTSITSFGIAMTGFGEYATAAYCTSGNYGSCNTLSVNSPILAASSTTAITLYFYGSGNVTSGQTYNYIIDFANGQWFSGSLTAQ